MAEAALVETTEIKPNNSEGRSKGRRMDTIPGNKCGMRTSNEVSEAVEHRINKRAKRTCEVTEAEATNQNVQQSNRDCHSDLKGKSRKRKLALPDAVIEEKIDLALSDGKEPLRKCIETASAHVLASEDLGECSKGRRKLKKINGSAKTLGQPQKFGNKVKTHKPECGKECLNAKQCNEDLISPSITNLSLLGSDKESSDRCSKRICKEKNKKLPNALKKVKFSVEGISKDNDNGISLDAKDEDAIKAFQVIQGARGQLEMEVPAKIDKPISSVNAPILLKCNESRRTICCAFCQSSEESEASGVMFHYLNGKLVADDQNAIKSSIHVHKNCAEWAPNVYFEDDNVVNFETELSRSRRIKCCCCGIKGASLGCYEKSCRKSFHVTCARLTPECRWDYENFVMLCPIHKSSQLPNEMTLSQTRHKRKSSAERKSCIHQDKVKTTEECQSHSDLYWKSQKKLRNVVLCCSALTNSEKKFITEFENLSGVTILKNWEPVVTHVIASVDENGACRRTLKFLMGILEGKWILSVQWVKACIEAGEIVAEKQHEISVDIHGIKDGPELGRLRFINKQPKLFDGCTFYLMGDFMPSYKGYLHDLVIAGGGKVLHRKPVGGDHAAFVIYSTELPDQCRPSNGSSVLNRRRAQAEALAGSVGAQAASNSWIMNSIAGYKLQKIGE